MSSRNLEVDRLRAIAILIIVYGHFCAMFFPQGIHLSLAFGTSLLDLSFIISGFVISLSLVSKVDSYKKHRLTLAAYVKSFYVRRIYRIYPAAVAVFLFVLVCSCFFSGGLFSTPRNTLEAGVYIFTYIFNFYFVEKYFSLALAPYWTLVMEEQFYWLFPIFLMLTQNNKQRVYICLFMLAVVNFIVRPMTLHYYPTSGMFQTQVRLDGFLYGFLIYVVTQQSWFSVIKPERFKNNIYSSVFVILLFLLIMSVTVLRIALAVILPVGTIIAAILVFAASFHSGVVTFPRYLETCLDFVGQRFYSLYLIHLPAILIAKSIYTTYHYPIFDYPFVLGCFALLLIACGMEALYRFVEIPSTKVGREQSSLVMEPFLAIKETNDIDSRHELVVERA